MTLIVYPEFAAGRQQLRLDMGRTKEKSAVSDKGRRSCTPVCGCIADSLIINHAIFLENFEATWWYAVFSLLVSVTGGCDLASQVDTYVVVLPSIGGVIFWIKIELDAKVRMQRARPFSRRYCCVSRGFFENSGIDESCCIFLEESTQRGF